MAQLTWVAVVVLACTAACSKKAGDEGVEAATKQTAPAGPAGSAGSPTATPPSPNDPKPLAPGELPAECTDYKTAMGKLASCTTIPPTTRDALKQSYEQAAATWATMSAESKTTLAKACKGGAESVEAATAGCK